MDCWRFRSEWWDCGDDDGQLPDMRDVSCLREEHRCDEIRDAMLAGHYQDLVVNEARGD